jgi:hypothetical protein
MARHVRDPLDCIPSAEAVRRELSEALTRAARLKELLDVAERIEQAAISTPNMSPHITKQAGTGAATP